MTIPTNFRFGYACINMELREKNIFMSRTLRLDTLKKKGMEYVKELCIKNLNDLYTMLEWNLKHDIFFMRLSSEMFPFASHFEHGYDISFVNDLLKKIGDYARQHNMRLTFHPAQYNVLSTPDNKILENTINDLKLHACILDKMGLDQDSIMIIHGGGVYGNKKRALERLEQNIENLPENVRNRLVLENCEMAYTVEDLLPISEKLGVPIVMDFHHDDINPSSLPIDDYFERVFKVWDSRGIKPKVHVSNSVPGVLKTDNKTKRRKHSDFIEYLHDSLLKITFPLDVMLECKMKERALLQLLQC